MIKKKKTNNFFINRLFRMTIKVHGALDNIKIVYEVFLGKT